MAEGAGRCPRMIADEKLSDAGQFKEHVFRQLIVGWGEQMVDEIGRPSEVENVLDQMVVAALVYADQADRENKSDSYTNPGQSAAEGFSTIPPC